MLTPCIQDLPSQRVQQRAAPATVPSSRALYMALADGNSDGAAIPAFLAAKLAEADSMPCDLPADPAHLAGWAAPRSAAVASQYRAYLAGRKEGAPRSYFSNRAHALYFLRCAAPTKLVDGAWLFGTLRRWHENEFRPLIKTYIEELGDGLPAKNHVVLYQRLLDNHACNDWRDLDQAHFDQGAIQLALAYGGEQYLPEMVGYNLGYEQLPLHLLITSYELNELGIDPYYFTLHVTVDNAATGHAHDAVDALQRQLATARDPVAFYRRVRAGYQLNELGAGTNAIIDAFDLEAELVRILADKAVVGQDMHGDYCRVA
ncbi:MAG: iron-containing redox enzyme family protein, partial [Telluria sp.]